MSALPAAVQWQGMTREEQLALCQRAIDAAPKCDDAAREIALQDAVAEVAQQLVRRDEVDELVGELCDAAPLLHWLAKQDIPTHHQSAFRNLSRKARALEAACDEIMERTA